MMEFLKGRFDSFFKKAEEKKAEEKVSVGIAEQLKGKLTGKVKIKEKDLEEMLSDLELELLQSDVTMDCAHLIKTKIKEKTGGIEFSSDNFRNEIKEKVKEALAELLIEGKIEVNRKPFVILFLGPNGAGKTTTIAKLAHHFKEQGKKVLLVASDTFRAAAIEQLEKHAGKLNLEIVKQSYGSDGAAVAFDGIKKAESRGFDIVLIDSAGRQDTNANLMREMEKLARVSKPDLKIFIGEAVAGNALVEQVRSFDRAVGIDGLIITKMDCDAKGGGILSVCSELKKPIYFYGIGEKYDALRQFSAKEFVEKILG